MIDALLSILISGILPFADTTAGRVWLQSAVEGGKFRNVYDAQTMSENRLGAQGSARKGNILLSGRFEYGYDYGRNSAWRGWTDPYSTPFMVCDSIPGNISIESYDMASSLGFSSGKWIVGLGTSYRTSLMAKHKDLRNKNQRMDFSIAPRASYRGERLRLDALAGYRRSTEQVEYMQVDGSSEKYLFQTYGLWFYTGSGFNSAEQKRLLSSHGAFGELNLDWSSGIFRISNAFSADYSLSRQSETGYNNLKHGDSRRLNYSDNLLLQAGKHSLDLSFALEQMGGWRYLQRQELDPSSGIRRWYSYGKPSQVYRRDILKLGVFYTFKRSSWSVKAGASYLDASHSYKEFPAVYSQSLSWTEPAIEATRSLQFSNGYGLTFSPSLSFKYCLSRDMLKKEILYQINSTNDGAQLMLPLREEFAYWSAEAIKASLDAGGWKSLKSGGRLRAGARIFWLQGIPFYAVKLKGCTGETENSARTGISLSLSYEF